MDAVKQVELKNHIWRDERGWGVNPFEALGISERLRGSMHLVSLKPGTVRGNHCHTNATEWILVFGGTAKIVWKTGKAGAVNQISVGDSDPALLEIPPDVEHAVVNDSGSDIYLAVFYDTPEPETLHCPAMVDPPGKKN